MIKLGQVRRSRKLTQTELARRLKTSQSAVSKWERGKNEPRMRTIKRIARVLKCALTSLT